MDKTTSRLRAAYLTLCILYLLWMAVLMVPEHRRQAWKLRLLRSCSRATSRLARRAGAASMGAELDGGGEAYGVPLLLSLCRERLDRAYNSTRPAG